MPHAMVFCPCFLCVARAVTRRTFKTAKQLAASQAARWKLARSCLGWHETPPAATIIGEPAIAKLGSKSVPREEAARVAVGSAAHQTLDDTRPRKRAVVRKPRKEKKVQRSGNLFSVGAGCGR